MFKRFWWMFLVMLPAGAFAGLVVAAAFTYFMPKMYESEAVIEVKPHPPVASLSGESMPSAIPPQFFGTEIEKITSRNTLEMVVDSLELTARWGMDKESTLQVLKAIVTAQNIRGTDLISVQARHTNKTDAWEIAGEVVKAYRNYRNELESRDAERRLEVLNKEVQVQENKVEERRKVLANLVRTKGIIYRGSDSSSGQSVTVGYYGTKSELQTFFQLERDKMQLETEIGSLLRYDGDQLLAYASGLEIPDNAIRNIYPRYLEAKRRVEAMQSRGMGNDDPAVHSENERIAAMKRDLDEGIVNLRTSLRVQLDQVSEEFDQLSNKVKIGKGQPAPMLTAQDYVAAKRAFEKERELLQAMKAQQMEAAIAARVRDETVVVHESPVIADAPVVPKVGLNLLLGATGGLLLSPLMAVLLIWVMDRLMPTKLVGTAAGP